ncbi:Pirin-like protein [Apiospora arundinis]
MKVSQWLSYLVSFGAPLVLANPNCPIWGAEFPKPQHLADNAIWKAAMANLTATFDAVDKTAANYSYTVQLFSTNPGPPILFERFTTAQNLPSNTTGVKKVDANTVFRLGSVTKIFTVLAYLAETGDKYFNHPITEFIPELQDIVNRRGNGPVDEVRTVKWEDITVEALLSQMSGIERDYLILGEIIGSVPLDRAVRLGFPPLGPKPPCGVNPPVQQKTVLRGHREFIPFFRALEDPSLLQHRLPAGLLRLGEDDGPLVRLVPELDGKTGWRAYIGDEAPSGNMYASTGDLTTLGRAIMGSTVLKPLLTRRWLKPVTYSSDNVAAVGMPWGLRRLRLSRDNPHRTVTAFTKAGGVGDYSSLLTILPEFDLGITSMADYIGAVVLPAYDAATRDDANSRYGGRYVADPAVYPNLQSSIEFTTDPAKPGLGVGTWVSNGTDMIPVAQSLQSGMAVPSDPNGGNATMASVRLYYTGLQSGTREAFKAVFEGQGAPDNPGTGFSTDCGTWIDYTGVTYAGMPLDEFIFESDSSGKVLSVKNLALNVTLQKV